MTSAHYLLSDMYVADDIHNVQDDDVEDNEDMESEHSEQVSTAYIKNRNVIIFSYNLKI